MTVKELREALTGLPDDLPVEIVKDGCCIADADAWWVDEEAFVLE